MKGNRRLRAITLCVCAAVIAVAAVTVSGASASRAKSTFDGKGALIVVLMPSTTNNYLAEWKRGLEETLKKANYTFKVTENNFDQNEQDVQVQQQIASGTKPALYVLWPADSKAGVASLRALSRTGVPVVVANQPPPPEALQFMSFYAGVDDYFNGQVSGQLMLKARAASLAAGNKLHSKGGNLIEIKFAPGYQASVARSQGFRDATKAAPFKILASEYAGFDNEAGYKTMSQLIAANKSKGIDFVYAHNDALGAGAIQALNEAGFKPGRNVMLVGGTCHGDLSHLKSGEEFGSGLQAARLEGTVVGLSVGRYFANGKKVLKGKDYPPPSKTFPVDNGPVHQFNYIPNPGVIFGLNPVKNQATLQNTMLWGKNMIKLCTY